MLSSNNGFLKAGNTSTAQRSLMSHENADDTQNVKMVGSDEGN